MKRMTLLALLVLSACAPAAAPIQAAPTPAPIAEMTDAFTYRIHRLLEEGATLTAMTIQGVSFEEYRQQLARAKGAYSLALSAQSGEGIPAEAVEQLNKAFTGWDLALSVWNAKIHEEGAPHAPDAVRYSELVEYVGLEQLPFLSGVPGEGDVEQDKVVRLLWGMATDHFTAAQDVLLHRMP